ncbi:MAG TPA: M17 family peptidase N-terminal domain-containing protein, partial [Chloroflexota bacterium]|nr:M17 family peptidase N-terminal domain-containing protein [Chloroflexota bacterium]
MKVTVAGHKPAEVSADVLAVNVFEGEKPSQGALAALDQQLNGLLSRLADLNDLPTKLYRTMLLPSSGSVAAPRLLLVGAGKRAEFDRVRAHRLASAAVRAAARQKISTVALLVEGGPVGREAGEAVASGAVVAGLDLGAYKTKPDESRSEITEVKVIPPEGQG